MDFQCRRLQCGDLTSAGTAVTALLGRQMTLILVGGSQKEVSGKQLPANNPNFLNGDPLLRRETSY
jgi:hypothetical protein